MATSADRIKQRIQQIIPEFNNISNASIYKRICDVLGVEIDTVNLEFIRSEQIIENSSINKRAFSKQWYIDTAYNFQFGDNLVIVDESTQREGYKVIDPSKRVIKQVGISINDNGIILIKVATSESNNELIPLSPDMQREFTTYINRFIPLGLTAIVTSQPADVFHSSNLYIYYRNDYSLISLQQKLRTELQNFQLAFNSDVPLYINDVESKIREIEGVRDAYFSNPYITYIENGVTKTTYPINNIITLQAGYFNFDPVLYDFTKDITRFIAV